MALEAVVFQQDPFSFGCRDIYAMGGGCSYGFGFEDDNSFTPIDQTHQLPPLHGNVSNCHSSSGSSVAKEWPDANSSSTEACTGGDGLLAGAPPPPVPTSCRRKRRRIRTVKNKEQVETQRMTHIAVERNRRRLMNEHLAVLRSLMPASYVQRGDQASIIGGAINFVKELEQLLQPLEAQKRIKQRSQAAAAAADDSTVFSDFFTFPQFSTYSNHYNSSPAPPESTAEKRSAIADVEVTMVETHANIKVLSRTRPKQLFKMVAWLHSVRLTILHLNVTTVDQMILYSFSAKVEDGCVLSSVNEIATAVYEMVGRIQGEALELP